MQNCDREIFVSSKIIYRDQLRTPRAGLAMKQLRYSFNMRPGSLHARDWEEMAALDPLWAILSSPEKRFGNWGLQEFLCTGQEEVSSLMQAAQRLGLPRQKRRAIDYGCGIGRLTKPFRTHFAES